jgi:hypothetical protein
LLLGAKYIECRGIMNSFLGVGSAASLLLGLATLVLPAGAARATSPTDCASVTMDFADPDATKECEDGDVGDNQREGRFRREHSAHPE